MAWVIFFVTVKLDFISTHLFKNICNLGKCGVAKIAYRYCCHCVLQNIILVNTSICISHRTEGPGREILKRPPPPIHFSFRVKFSFRTVTLKSIAVFSRNFAGTCTMSWGVLYSFWYWWDVKYWRKKGKFFFSHYMFSSRFMLFPTFLENQTSGGKKNVGGGD